MLLENPFQGMWKAYQLLGPQKWGGRYLCTHSIRQETKYGKFKHPSRCQEREDWSRPREDGGIPSSGRRGKRWSIIGIEISGSRKGESWFESFKFIYVILQGSKVLRNMHGFLKGNLVRYVLTVQTDFFTWSQEDSDRLERWGKMQASKKLKIGCGLRNWSKQKSFHSEEYKLHWHISISRYIFQTRHPNHR